MSAIKTAIERYTSGQMSLDDLATFAAEFPYKTRPNKLKSPSDFTSHEAWRAWYDRQSSNADDSVDEWSQAQLAGLLTQDDYATIATAIASRQAPALG